jgi:hypothetical protein
VATIAAARTNAADWDAVKALTVGTPVQISAGSRTASGKIGRTSDDVVVVTSGKGEEMFDRQQVSVVSVKKPGHRGRNALIGLAAGAGAGLGIGIATRARPDQLKVISNGTFVVGITAAGALAGTIVGFVIPTGGWREIYRK